MKNLDGINNGSICQKDEFIAKRRFKSEATTPDLRMSGSGKLICE